MPGAANDHACSSTPSGYLLDTNILVLYARAGRIGGAIERQFGLLASRYRPTVSVVSIGEVRSLALRLGWGPAKMGELAKIVSSLVKVDINDERILDAYASIDASPVGRARNFGKNDLWIAATAKVLGYTLLTTDADFDALHPSQMMRVRIDPSTGQVVP